MLSLPFARLERRGLGRDAVPAWLLAGAVSFALLRREIRMVELPLLPAVVLGTTLVWLRPARLTSTTARSLRVPTANQRETLEKNALIFSRNPAGGLLILMTPLSINQAVIALQNRCAACRLL